MPEMMGRQTTEQTRLFYEFRLEDRMPEGHLLRRIDGLTSAAPQKKALAGTRAGVSHMSDTGRHGYGVMVNQPLMLRKKAPLPTWRNLAGLFQRWERRKCICVLLKLGYCPTAQRKPWRPLDH